MTDRIYKQNNNLNKQYKYKLIFKNKGYINEPSYKSLQLY